MVVNCFFMFFLLSVLFVFLVVKYFFMFFPPWTIDYVSDSQQVTYGGLMLYSFDTWDFCSELHKLSWNMATLFFSTRIAAASMNLVCLCTSLRLTQANKSLLNSTALGKDDHRFYGTTQWTTIGPCCALLLLSQISSQPKAWWCFLEVLLTAPRPPAETLVVNLFQYICNDGGRWLVKDFEGSLRTQRDISIVLLNQAAMARKSRRFLPRSANHRRNTEVQWSIAPVTESVSLTEKLLMIFLNMYVFDF